MRLQIKRSNSLSARDASGAVRKYYDNPDIILIVEKVILSWQIGPSHSRVLSCVTGEMLQKPDESAGRVSLGKCAAGRQAETRRVRERASTQHDESATKIALRGVKNARGECFESHAYYRQGSVEGHRVCINRLLSEALCRSSLECATRKGGPVLSAETTTLRSSSPGTINTCISNPILTISITANYCPGAPLCCLVSVLTTSRVHPPTFQSELCGSSLSR